jgi:hypothetical protein
MPVTDHQVAALRALLAGNFDEHRKLLARLRLDADREGYSALVTAGFFEAADRRFADGHTAAEIAGFVAWARATTDDAADKIDPRIAERLIRGVFEDENMHDVGGQTLMETQLLLLAALVSEARFTDSELDAFMVGSRKLAERWTS